MLDPRHDEFVTAQHTEADLTFGPCSIPGCPTGSLPDEAYEPLAEDQAEVERIISAIATETTRVKAQSRRSVE